MRFRLEPSPQVRHWPVSHEHVQHSVCVNARRYIPSFLEMQRRTGCDIVTGTRYCKGGGVAGWSLSRKIVSRGANLVASFLLGATTSDLTGAYRLYRKAVLEDLLSSTTSVGYAFQMEVRRRAWEGTGLLILSFFVILPPSLLWTLFRSSSKRSTRGTGSARFR